MVSFTPVEQSTDTPKGGVNFVPVDGGDSQAKAHEDARKTAEHDDPVMRSLLGGSTLGWMNELSADEYAGVVGAENAFRKVTGKPVPYGMSEARDAMLQERRKSSAAFHEKHPDLDEALSLGGGALTPGIGKVADFVKGGASWITRAGRSALSGGGLGVVAGASDEKDRTRGAIGGGIAGFTLSGGLHLLGSAVTSGLPAVAKMMKTPLVETWQNIQKAFGGEDPKATPEEIAAAQKKALEYVHDLAQSSGKTPQDIANNPDAALGKPVLGAEAIGRPGVSQLAAVGRRSGTTPDELESTLRTRAHWAPSRIASDLSEITKVDPASIEGDFNQQIKAMRSKAAPLYEVAYKKSVDTPQLREFLNRDAVKKALVRARRIASNEGINPDEVGLQLKGQTSVGAHGDDALQLVEVKNPTMRTWDYIKRGLDDELEESRDKLTKKLNLNEESRAILNTVTDLRTALFKESPEYELAVAQGGEAPRQMEAYQAAPELMKPNITLENFKNRIEKYTPAQREALKGGFIADIYNRTMNNKLRLRDMQSPAFTEKARAILGFDEANQFLEKAESEMRLGATGGRMMPGTQSATMELGAADAERNERVTSLARSALEFGKGNPVKAITHLYQAGEATAKTADLDEAARNEVGRLLMLPPKELSKILGDHEKSRAAQPAKSFLRKLAEDPDKLKAARIIVLTMGQKAAQPNNNAAAQ